MIELPYELNLALGKIINSETSLEYEVQEIIFILYKENGLTWDEIKEKSTIPSMCSMALDEAVCGLWVVGFIEMDEDDEYIKRYELTRFGRELLEGILSPLMIVGGKQ